MMKPYKGVHRDIKNEIKQKQNNLSLFYDPYEFISELVINSIIKWKIFMNFKIYTRKHISTYIYRVVFLCWNQPFPILKNKKDIEQEQETKVHIGKLYTILNELMYSV